MTKRAKKITAKRKAAPSPVVVLEEWDSPTYKGDRCRLIYDAELDMIIGQVMLGGFPNPTWDSDYIVSSEWKAMPV